MSFTVVPHVGLALGLVAAGALSPQPIFQGKNSFPIVVGFVPGAGYDTQALVISCHRGQGR